MQFARRLPDRAIQPVHGPPDSRPHPGQHRPEEQREIRHASQNLEVAQRPDEPPVKPALEPSRPSRPLRLATTEVKITKVNRPSANIVKRGVSDSRSVESGLVAERDPVEAGLVAERGPVEAGL